MDAGPSAPAPVEDNTKAAYLDGAAVAFTGGLKASQKNDVINSKLLAQLAANKKYDREKDTVNWYKQYREVMENIGWAIDEFHFAQMSTSGADFTADQAVLEVLQAICTQDEIAVAMLNRPLPVSWSFTLTPPSPGFGIAERP